MVKGRLRAACDIILPMYADDSFFSLGLVEAAGLVVVTVLLVLVVLALARWVGEGGAAGFLGFFRL